MRTRSLVPRPNTTFIGLGTTLSAQGKRTMRAAGTVSSRSQGVVTPIGTILKAATGDTICDRLNLAVTP